MFPEILAMRRMAYVRSVRSILDHTVCTAFRSHVDLRTAREFFSSSLTTELRQPTLGGEDPFFTKKLCNRRLLQEFT